MMLYEIVWFIAIVLDVIFCIFFTICLIILMTDDFDWDELDLMVFSFFMIWGLCALPFYFWLNHYFEFFDVLISFFKWWIWSWKDFWTMEISPLDIFISFIFIVGISICIYCVFCIKKILKKNKCKCGARIKGDFCSKCGKKRGG